MSGIKIGSESGNGNSPGLYYKESAPAQINLNSPESVEKWMGILGLSKKELINAVECFGADVRNIRRGLLKQKSEDEAA